MGEFTTNAYDLMYSGALVFSNEKRVPASAEYST